MMNIKKFAKLCNCNPQTLRYYDSINLLKPVNVDCFTGYRYYNASQALDYLKIKKLQDASFSIEEIKKLLTCDDEKIYDALQQKIEEQKAKLLELKNIQKSYHKDMKEMKEKVNEIKEKIMKTSNELDYKDLIRELLTYCKGNEKFKLTHFKELCKTNKLKVSFNESLVQVNKNKYKIDFNNSYISIFITTNNLTINSGLICDDCNATCNRYIKGIVCIRDNSLLKLL